MLSSDPAMLSLASLLKPHFLLLFPVFTSTSIDSFPLSRWCQFYTLLPATLYLNMRLLAGSLHICSVNKGASLCQYWTKNKEARRFSALTNELVAALGDEPRQPWFKALWSCNQNINSFFIILAPIYMLMKAYNSNFHFHFEACFLPCKVTSSLIANFPFCIALINL